MPRCLAVPVLSLLSSVEQHHIILIRVAQTSKFYHPDLKTAVAETQPLVYQRPGWRIQNLVHTEITAGPASHQHLLTVFCFLCVVFFIFSPLAISLAPHHPDGPFCKVKQWQMLKQYQRSKTVQFLRKHRTKCIQEFIGQTALFFSSCIFMYRAEIWKQGVSMHYAKFFFQAYFLIY